MLKLILRLTLLGGILGAVVSWACRSTPGPTSTEKEPEWYSLSPSILALDTAFVPWHGAEGQVVLTNHSSGTLTFSGFQGECPKEITWEPASGSVPAKSSRTFDFRFQPQHRVGIATCRLAPVITQGGKPTPSGQQKFLSVQYQAGEAACEILPADGQLDFGMVETGAQSEQTLTIRNTTTRHDMGVPFKYQFSPNSDDCGRFAFETPADITGTLEPGDEKVIQFSFMPGSDGDAECVSTLATIQTGVRLPSPCPSPVVFSGTGLPNPEPICVLAPSNSDTLDFGEVPVGMAKYMDLRILNQNESAVTSNQFKYLFDDPVGDCALFPIDPADMEGFIGPGGFKDIRVWLAPKVGGSFQCTRSLSSLKEPADQTNPFIASPCPAEIVWKGTGLGAPPLQWSACQPDGATTWTGVFGFSDAEVLMVGEGGNVFESAGDCEWAAVGTIPEDAEGVNLTDIWGYSDGTGRAVYAVGNIPPEPGLFNEAGAIVKWNGTDWTLVDKDGLHTYSSVWGSASNNVYFGGAGVATDFPNAKHWDGNTLVPLRISDMGMNNVAGLAGTGPTDIWAVMDQPFTAIYRLGEYGWENGTPSFSIEPVRNVVVYTTTLETEVIAVGDEGAIYHHDGSEWEDVSISGETRDFQAVWVSPNGRVFVVGDDQALYLGDVDDPTEWTVMPPPPGTPTGDFLDVWGSSDDDIYIVGSDNVVLHLTPGG